MKAVENLVVEILWRQLAQDHVVDAAPDLGQPFAVQPLDVLGQRAGDVCEPAGRPVGKAVIISLEHHHSPGAAPTGDARAERACGNPALLAAKKVRDEREIGRRIRRLREDAAGRLVTNAQRRDVAAIGLHEVDGGAKVVSEDLVGIARIPELGGGLEDKAMDVLAGPWVHDRGPRL